ncbi:hypothetical protein GOODEAATRI_027045 [Goodea atripinnis]|uniref:Uncharacterized protein n=1 Tax=Goodea atripinnis TaxID=208336 RepID=A0ABV0N4S2_9TELE
MQHFWEACAGGHRLLAWWQCCSWIGLGWAQGSKGMLSQAGVLAGPGSLGSWQACRRGFGPVPWPRDLRCIGELRGLLTLRGGPMLQGPLSLVFIFGISALSGLFGFFWISVPGFSARSISWGGLGCDFAMVEGLAACAVRECVQPTY